MMLYPTIQELTAGKINRYELVIATAKGARQVIEKEIEKSAALQQKRDAEKIASGNKQDKKTNIIGENLKEKAVSISIKKIHNGEFTIVNCSGLDSEGSDSESYN